MFGSLIPLRGTRNGNALASPRTASPVTRVRDEFDRLFDSFFSDWPTLWEGAGRDRLWGLDVKEKDDTLVVRAEAPGFEPEDFDLQVRGNQLVLRASHKEETGKEGEVREWHSREFHRTVTLPADINPEKVEAKYRHGVLTITLPKAETSQARRITVQS